MKNSKIILFGCNTLGLEAARRLSTRKQQFCLADNDESHIKLAEEQGFEARLADHRNDEVLRSLGIGHDIAAIFCFFPDDSENVFLTISARALAPRLKIVSVIDAPEAADKLRAAGADKIIDPYEVSGRKIYDLIKRPIIVDILDETVFGRHDLKLAEIEIPPYSHLENVPLSRLRLHQRFNLILLGVVDRTQSDDLHLACSRIDHRLTAGHVLVLLGPPAELMAFQQEIAENSRTGA